MPGATTAAVTITPIDDTAVEPLETVVLALATGTDYEIGSPNTDTVNLFDNDTLVTVEATDSKAYEANLDTGTFTITRTGNTSSDLTVSYTMGGTSAAGSDYESLNGSVTILAGQSTATLTVMPIDDLNAEPTETATLTIDINGNYTVGTPQGATVNVVDNDTVITVAATDPDADEEGVDPGMFTFTRNGDITEDLLVSYTVAGTATLGDDYDSLSGSVTILAGQSTATVLVTPVDDNIVELPETVDVTVAPSLTYTVGSPDTDTVTIADNDARITVEATDPDAYEANLDTGTFTFTRSGYTQKTLTVSYSVSGSATPGDDYETLPGTLIFAVGETSKTVTVTPVDDSEAEPKETVDVSIDASPDYEVGMPGSATVNIIDNDTIITVEATDPDAYEAGQDPGTFTFTRDGYLGADLIVYYTVSGTATPEDDYTSSPGQRHDPGGPGFGDGHGHAGRRPRRRTGRDRHGDVGCRFDLHRRGSRQRHGRYLRQRHSDLGGGGGRLCLRV